MATRRYVIEITTDEDEVVPSGDEACDELLDALCAYDGYPPWVQSIDNVETSKGEVGRWRR